MAKSTYQFDRWKPRNRFSWAWRVFKKHNTELLRMYTCFDNSKKYTYQNLGKASSGWKDLPTKHFSFSKRWEYEQFKDLKDWSSAYNELENWINLNALVAISSSLETYMATIIPMAIESDVGVLYGTPRRIDGIEIVKHGGDKPFNFEDVVISCTKGSWQSRLNSYEKLFGKVPKYLLGQISDLEKIRVLRNDVAHAFGRDIEASRKKGMLTTEAAHRLSRDRTIKLQGTVWKAAKAIDAHLHNFHIGEYQSLLFYHDLYPTLNHMVHPSIRAMDLKKAIGRHGDIPAGKEFCKGLVAYYEGL